MIYIIYILNFLLFQINIHYSLLYKEKILLNFKFKKKIIYEA